MYNNIQYRYNSFYSMNVASPYVQGGCINPIIHPSYSAGIPGVRFFTIG